MSMRPVRTTAAHRSILQFPVLAFTAGLLGPSLGCNSEPITLVETRCSADSQCDEGNICVEGACVPRTELACTEDAAQQAILQPGPPLVDFGYTGSGTHQAELVMRNIGNCTLTIFEAYFEREDAPPFECPQCAPDQFPIELFPFRDHAVTLFFTPDGIGDYADNLVLLSDDPEFSEIRVPVRARFNGVPKLTTAPELLDFDYAPVGRTVTKTIELTNAGTGIAPLVINQIEIDTATASAFSFDPELTEPLELDPITVNRDEKFVVNVSYHPEDINQHFGEVVVHTNLPQDPIVRIPIQGSSQTPAKISVSPEALDLGPVPLGQTTSLPLTIVNEGGTPLRVNYRWSGTGLSTDLSATPQIVPAIAPGQFTELLVLVTATSPGPIVGLLIIESNDPNRPAITVPVSAQGQETVGVQVLKIDMSFENGSDSAFDDDFRNVDMILENPFGLICDKANRQPDNWGSFGNPSWLAFAPKEEPERIVLPDAQQDGTYRVALNYVEDCSSVPTGLVAGLLGISIDALIAYLTGGVPIPGVGGGDIADIIADICFSHSSSSVTVTVWLNGEIIAEAPVTLGRKGDYVYAVDLVRENGEFRVQP